MRGFFLILIGTIILFPCLFTDEYEFDVSEFEKKSLEFKGNLEFRSIINILDTDSHLFNLIYFQESQKKVAKKFQFRLELFPSLVTGSFKFFTGLNIVGLTKNHVFEIDSNLYEAYIKYSPGKALTFYVGKKVVKWGKGYAWNPVSFAGRQKDLNDIDANLEGFNMVYGTFIKSFSSPLKNMAVTTILLYNDNDLNRDFPGQRESIPLRDYLFCRVSQPEPFNMLYFNAAIYNVFNINDKSLMTSLEFKSTRFENLEFLVKFMFLFGKDNTEFGDKINNSQVQFRLKWYF